MEENKKEKNNTFGDQRHHRRWGHSTNTKSKLFLKDLNFFNLISVMEKDHKVKKYLQFCYEISIHL